MSIDQYSTTPSSNDLTNYFKTGMRPSAVKTAGWDVMADIASYVVSLPAVSGSANALTVSNGRPFGALPVTGGLMQILNPLNANTGPATLAPDGLAATAIYANGVALVGGELQPNVPACLKWDGTRWNLLNPTPPGRNFMVDPCCRVAQGDGTTTISTSYQYGLVDLVQCKSTGSVGKITQDSVGTAGGVTPYSCKLQNVTTTSGGKVFFRRWIESRDAAALKNKTTLFSVLCYQDSGTSINAFLTLNKATAQDNFGGVTLIATGPTVSLANTTATAITAAVNMGDCSNGVEIILEMDCGVVTTKNFHATDWQASIGTLPQSCAVPRFDDDLLAAMRYFESSYAYGTAPGTASSAGTAFRAAAGVTNGTNYGETIKYKVRKLGLPTVTIYSSSSGANGNVFDSTLSVDKVMTQFNKTSESVETVNNSGGTITSGDIMRYLYTADSRL